MLVFLSDLSDNFRQQHESVCNHDNKKAYFFCPVLSFLFYTVLAEVSGLSWFISCFRVFMDYSIGEAVASYNTKKVRYLNMQSSNSNFC